MSITSEADWKGLREIGRIVRLALDALERHAQAGVSTAELDEVAARVFVTPRSALGSRNGLWVSRDSTHLRQ